MKFISIITLAVAFSLPVFAADFKIGWVDMQKAIQTSKAGKKAKAGLEKEFNKKKKQLEKKQKDLEKMSKDLEKKKLALSEKAFVAKQRDLQKEFLKYQEEARNSQLEIRKKENKLTGPILQKIQKVISDVAKDKGYAYVLEKSEQSVLWAKKEYDITDLVIKKINK